MNYYCGDIIDENDKDGCKREGMEYNQCCQECEHKEYCLRKCDYADGWGCIAKFEDPDIKL